MSLEAIIKNHIGEHGAMTIAQYMEFALSHPEYGYYMQRDPFGKEGDFTTSPEISQVFGEVIGIWLAHQWQLLGSPDNVALVELGAGRGTLMADILRATKHVPDFHDAVHIHIVEISPALRQKQWKTLAGKHERIAWHGSVDDIPEFPLLLVANEFFDALPIRQFVCRDGVWHERMVDVKRNKLAFVNASIFEMPKEISNIDPEGMPSDESEFIMEVCAPAIAIAKKISKHIAKHGGAALIIDYGYTEPVAGDSLQAVKNHTYHDVLKEVGSADITAHVDFSALKKAAKIKHVKVYGAVEQGAFLMRLGAGERTTILCENAGHDQQKILISGLKRLADPGEMGELFKVLAITSKDIVAVEGFE